MKITKIKEDITSEIANSFKGSIAIDTEATGLQIPERDKLSLIQICDEDGNVIGNANVRPELNTLMYEVEFPDGEIRPYAANIIADNIWTRLIRMDNAMLYSSRSLIIT